MAVVIISVAVGSVIFIGLLGVAVGTVCAVYARRKKGRENNRRAEEPPEQPRRQARHAKDRCGEARREMRPAHSSRAGELTRRGRSGGRVTYNEHGGEERDSTEVMIIASPDAECDCPIPADASRPSRVEGGESSRRAGHNTYNRRISPPAKPTDTKPGTQSECGGWKDGACGSASAPLPQPLSCTSEMFAAVGVTKQNPTLEVGKLCGGRETTRQEHYMSMKQHFKTCEKDSTLIWFTGHGQRGTGDWVFLDGVITFMDVFGLYQNYFMGRKLTIVCDCCYSGHWVEKLAMKLDEYGIPSCGHRAKALDIKLRIVASCQKDQQCREKSFQKSLCLNEDGTIGFPREMRLSDNQTTAHIDTTEIRCSSGVYGTCSVSTRMTWKMS